MGLPYETVDLGHFVQPGLGPAFLRYRSLDLESEGFNIFWVGKKLVKCICERLYIIEISGP
jgi:hypothetical protein